MLFKPVDPPRLRGAVAELLSRAGVAVPAPVEPAAETTEASLRQQATETSLR